MTHPPSTGVSSADLEMSSTAVCVNGNIMPVVASQTRKTSHDFEIILNPSGENATERIESSWPRGGVSISTPVLASQTRMVLSSDPETILDPSGENATERIQ